VEEHNNNCNMAVTFLRIMTGLEKKFTPVKKLRRAKIEGEIEDG
jgi:hypothetical protein